ncbi:hypothetical protein HDZ31DRAFT_80861 [Schizophyllum fasciatum]
MRHSGLWIPVLRVLYSNILFTPALPTAYYAHGNATEQCTTPHADDLKYCEDAVFWDIYDQAAGPRTARRALISCDAGRKGWNTVMGPMLDPEPKGSLWVMDVSVGAAPTHLVLEGFPPNHDFHPLGLDIAPAHGGEPSHLFIVNHARGRTCIEQFSVSPRGQAVATYVRTLDSPQFMAANSLALTSPTSFLVTNDHRFTRRLSLPFNHVLPIAESILSLPLGWAAHVMLDIQEEGAKDEVPGSAASRAHANMTVNIAASSIPFANGVAISPARDMVAIASTTTAEVRLYEIGDPAGPASFEASLAGLKLNSKDRNPVLFLPDNVHFADDGSLIVAGHPNFPKIDALAKGGSAPAGSWVVRVAERGAGAGFAASRSGRPRYDITTLYQSNGAQFQSSTTGLHDIESGLLIVTGLYADPGVLVCTSAS